MNTPKTATVRIRQLILCLVLLLGSGAFPACTTNGMISDVQQIRVGMGGNGIGTKDLHQYYLLFGCFRLNEVSVERVVSDYTSYDITTGCSYSDWFWSILLMPFTVTRQTVRIDY